MLSRPRKDYSSPPPSGGTSYNAGPSARVWYAFLGLCFLAVLRQYSLQPSPALPRPVVTLATTKLRASHELPTTLRSLLHQSLSPREIQVHVPREEKEAFETAVQSLARPLRQLFAHESVRIRFGEDLGPGTKLIPALAAMLEAHDDMTPLVVLDDDHLYHPRLLEALVRAHIVQGRRAAVGTRGWRVRQDLAWGVKPDEYDNHVHLGWFLSAPYRVGVLTANDGYLVLPAFFRASACDDAQTSQATARPAVLDPMDETNPQAAHLVDDIWINGQLARNCIPRYIVPVPGANLDVTRTHVLEGHMRSDGMSRAHANDVMLRFFKDAWAREDIWFQFGGKAQPTKAWAVVRWLVECEKGWRWLWGR